MSAGMDSIRSDSVRRDIRIRNFLAFKCTHDLEDLLSCKTGVESDIGGDSLSRRNNEEALSSLRKDHLRHTNPGLLAALNSKSLYSGESRDMEDNPLLHQNSIGSIECTHERSASPDSRSGRSGLNNDPSEKSKSGVAEENYRLDQRRRRVHNKKELMMVKIDSAAMRAANGKYDEFIDFMKGSWILVKNRWEELEKQYKEEEKKFTATREDYDKHVVEEAEIDKKVKEQYDKDDLVKKQTTVKKQVEELRKEYKKQSDKIDKIKEYHSKIGKRMKEIEDCIDKAEDKRDKAVEENAKAIKMEHTLDRMEKQVKKQFFYNMLVATSQAVNQSFVDFTGAIETLINNVWKAILEGKL